MLLSQGQAAIISSWTQFYEATAGVSVTLFSVMFVTLQVKSESWHTNKLKSAVAVAALAELMIPFLAGVVILMAGNPWRLATWIVGGFGIVIVLYHWYSYARWRKSARRWDTIQAITSTLSLAVYVAVVYAGFLAPTLGLRLLASALVWLLFSGASESWLLLSPKTEDSLRKSKIKVPAQHRTDAVHSFGRSQPSAQAVADPPPDLSSQALEPLDPNVLRRRVIEVFPVGYLTLIAIIQGAAFGLLLVNAQQQLTSGHQFIDQFATISQSAAGIVVIVIVTHQYLLLTTLVRWTPTILDTLIPYLVGLGEILMALTVGRSTEWWVALAILLVVAILSFVHTGRRVSEAIFGGHANVHTSFQNSLRAQIVWCAILLGAAIAGALLDSFNLGEGWIDATLPCLLVLGGIAVEVVGEIDQNKIYDNFGIPRWTANLHRKSEDEDATAPSTGTGTSIMREP